MKSMGTRLGKSSHFFNGYFYNLFEKLEGGHLLCLVSNLPMRYWKVKGDSCLESGIITLSP